MSTTEIYTLRDTVDGMLSKDYKDRFRAEYFQLKIRFEKLEEIIEKAEHGELDFKLRSNLEVLKLQLEAMRAYLVMLQIRAEQEKVEIY